MCAAASPTPDQHGRADQVRHLGQRDNVAPEKFVRDHVMLPRAFGIPLTEEDINALRRLGARKGNMADLERFGGTGSISTSTHPTRS